MTPANAIDRAWIAARIPHQGSMCLLDAVESWDEHHIVCRAGSHSHRDNPLRASADCAGGELGIANAIEYAAQAMAVHGALLAEKLRGAEAAAPKAGYLTSVRDVRWQRSRFDDIAGDLRIDARRLSGNDINILYAFEIHAAAELLVSGRASVVLDAAGLTADANKTQRSR